MFIILGRARDLIAGEALQLVTPVEGLDKGFGFAPAGLDDDAQFQINAGAEQRLNLNTRAGANRFELGAAFADEDCLLAVALAVDGGGNAGEREADFTDLAGGPFFLGGAGSGSSNCSMTTADA